MGGPRREKSEPSLLSASTILILSGFLVGIASASLAGDELSPFVAVCGLAGCLAFLIFDLAGKRRVVQSAEAEQRQMEKRLERHVTSMNYDSGLFAEFDLPPVRRSNPRKDRQRLSIHSPRVD